MKYIATYRLATNAFIQGHESLAKPELRTPSIKGVLRFWWRAIALSAFDDDIKRMRLAERWLLGSTDGQAAISMRLELLTPESVEPPGRAISSGTAYLAGQGLFHHNEGSTRAAIKEGPRFKLHCRLGARHEKALQKENSKDQRLALELLERTLWCIGLFGGVGSRSRRGFGSFAIEDLQGGQLGLTAPKSAPELAAAIELVLPKSSLTSLPEFSAFSEKASVTVFKSASSAAHSLETLGVEFALFRSYGRGGGVMGRASEKNFKDDHDSVKDAIAGKGLTQAPRRVVFGLPHNYFYSSGGKTDINPQTHKRRASPLFFHIHSFSDGTSALVMVFLPARFLPDKEEISITGPRLIVPLPENLWKPIHDFLNRMKTSQNSGFTFIKEVF
ncbi:MAG: type III-B CRISPR module RAMP protein Cmr1 [Planctomycetes bacterium]|jgi:CRISPR-associated protein Cmr1|nr:type III-B CRISPR module RAMP protein Cmr1 [Planctomycetota bacterium]